MVDRGLSKDATDFGEVLRAAIGNAGGFDLVMDSEARGPARAAVIEPLLDRLDVWDLEPYEEMVQLEAAAVACRTAGSLGLPYPVAARLARHPDLDADALGLTTSEFRIDMVDIPLRWAAVDLAGELYRVTPVGPSKATRLGPFVGECSAEALGRRDQPVLVMAMNLASFTLLGMVEGAFGLTHKHVKERVQFGSALIDFQVVQHQLADALTAVQAVDEMARYALWSQMYTPDAALVDAVSLRALLLSCAQQMFRMAHQLHGATGFCDESVISWLSRHSQPFRRLPLNVSATERWLKDLIEQHAFLGLFSDGSAAQDAGQPWGAAGPDMVSGQ